MGDLVRFENGTKDATWVNKEKIVLIREIFEKQSLVLVLESDHEIVVEDSSVNRRLLGLPPSVRGYVW